MNNDDEALYKKWYLELIEVVYAERPEGENERPDPRYAVRQLHQAIKACCASVEARTKRVEEQAAIISELEFDLRNEKAGNASACHTVALMHAAAVGEITGPIRGVVEDVEAVRLRAEKAEAELARVKGDSEAWNRSYNIEKARVEELEFDLSNETEKANASVKKLEDQIAYKTRQVDSLYRAREDWEKRASEAEASLQDLRNGDLTP